MPVATARVARRPGDTSDLLQYLLVVGLSNALHHLVGHLFLRAIVVGVIEQHVSVRHHYSFGLDIHHL